MVWLKEPGRKSRHAYDHIDAMVSLCGLQGMDSSLFDESVPKCQRCEIVARMKRRKKAKKP